MIHTNYHTHTTRCGHATGTDEAYVQGAIEGGFSELGFSDHVFLPNYNRSVTMRGDYSELDDYCESVAHLKQHYASQIKIYTAFECEYFSRFHEYYASLLTTKRMDYLILAAHYLRFDEDMNRMQDYAGAITTPEGVERYGEIALMGMDSGLFVYFAHPDLFLSSYPQWDTTCEKVTRLIVARAKELNMPLEFNQGGIRFKGQFQIGNEFRYRYPVRQFWDIVREMQVPVILGVDAHSPADFTAPARYIAEQLIDAWGLRSLLVTQLHLD